MASMSDRIYFPPLEECLFGDRVVLSWRHVATALSDYSGRRQTTPAIIDFFDDEYVHGLLKDPSSVFARPSDATQREYQTKTAPINTTTASYDRININIVKEDAEWLSRTARLNLLAALRVIIVEIQSRPAQHLTTPLSSQDAANLQEAAGLNNGQGNSFLSELGAGNAADADEIWTDFENPDQRKRRIFDTYLTERRYFMMTADFAHSIKIYGRLPIHAPVAGNLAQLYRMTMTGQTNDEVDALLSAYIRIVGDRMGRLDTGVKDMTDDNLLQSEDTEISLAHTLLIEVIHAMSVVFQLADNLEDRFPPPTVVSSWFSIMDQYAFLSNVQPFHPIIAELVFPLRTLAAVASVGLLKPNRCMEYFLDPEKDPASADNPHDSWLSSEVLEQVHNITVAATEAKIDSASPVSLSWSVILHGMNLSYHKRSEKRDNLLLQSARERFEAGNVVRGPPGRRNSAGSMYSIESSRFDTFLENGAPSKDLQASRRICDAATENGYVYNVISGIAFGTRSSPGGCMTPLLSSRIRASFMEAVQAAEPFIGYQDAPVRTVLAILAVDREYWDIAQDHILPSDQDVVASTARGAWLQERILQIAIERNPHELLPFIMLFRSLCSTLSLEDDEFDQILGLLRHTPTLAVILPESAKWVSVSDGPDPENSYYRLLNDVPLVPQSSSWTCRKPEEEDFYIPANTLFRFLDQAGTASIVEYNHSTLALLGQRLDVNLSRERELLFELLDAETTAEVISFFATLIHVDCLKAATANPNGSIVHLESDILHEASKHLSGGRDIVTVVCATMDYYLQDELAMSDENAVAVLNSCVQFLHSILPLHPSRVWSYLARCELLSSESKAGKLAKITGTLDLNSSRYDFLKSSVRLFSDLIETAMTSAVQRRVGSKAVGRQRPDANPWLGTSDKVLSRVSYSIAQASVDIFENTSTWRFESPDKQTSLLESVVPILHNLISYCYGMGDMQNSSGLTSTLRPAASYVVDCFVQPSTGTLRFQPMLSSLVEACLSGESTLYISKYQSLYTQVTSVMDFATSLLRVSNLLEVSSNMIETYLFKSCTLLARLSGVSPHLRVPALRLLNALVVNAGKSTSEPPSLLGYLGPQISKSFLQQLSTLGKPFSLTHDVKTTWKFFSSILRNRQQWMSNCLLTGQTPREAMKEAAKKGEMVPDSIFGIALKKLSRLNELDSFQALVILDFVASAQNYWPWTVFTLQKDTSYLDGLRNYVRELQPSHVTAKTSVTKAVIDARIAAYIGETLAMQLYHSRHLGNADDLAEKLVADIDYYLRDGVEVAGYNKSLHTNFARNFSNKYAGCSLDEFQRTLLEPRELGVDFYYDLERASTMLGFDPGWLGRKQNGFKSEMERANANLSLVDAQIALFHAWEFLLLELSVCLPTNDTIATQMLQVAQQCLNANQVVPGPESIFLKVVDARASLALVLTQRLATSSRRLNHINHLLTTVVGTIVGVENPFSPETVLYYRKLLKALFVILRAYQANADKASSGKEEESMDGTGVTVTQTVLNVLDRIVGRGFRSLVSLIHDDQASVCPEDLALLTAILQASLSLPGIEQSQTQILNIMASHNCFYAATSLFSWADKLADQGDPIYGELSILYLLELSTLPGLAEQMACDGIMSIILTANLTKYMMKANISPYSDIPVAQRCYGIWVKGLLPLMLNLLTALGATVAPEIGYVLNQFPHLLSLSIDRFEAPGASRTQSRTTPHYLTLLGTSEIHSLALLTRVLSALRLSNNRDVPEVEWDATSLLENVEFWLASNKLLKERLIPLGQREMEWRSMKTAAGANRRGENVLEAKVIAQLEAVRDVLSEELEAE